MENEEVRQGFLTVLGGNSWDWIIVFMLLIFAIATGVKDGDKPVIPRPILIRTYGLLLLVFILLNIQAVIRLFTG